jgi:hypothetical protein
MGPRFFSVDHVIYTTERPTHDGKLQWGHASSAWIT